MKAHLIALLFLPAAALAALADSRFWVAREAGYASFRAALLSLSLFGSFSALADVNYEVSAGYGFASFDDPDGDSAGYYSTAGVGIVVPMNRGRFVESTIFYVSGGADGDKDNVNNSLTGYGVAIKYQIRYPISRAFSEVYLSPGLSFVQASYSNRWSVDSDGYLKAVYDDRETTEFTALFSALYKFRHGRAFTSVPGLSVGIPLGGAPVQYGATYSLEF